MQWELFNSANPEPQQEDLDFQARTEPNLSHYDKVIVCFSGGKDSTASLLHLLDSGIDKAKVELWHHDIDGAEPESFMDWPVTKAYCKAFAEAFELPIYFSWREGGFEREMNRDNQLTGDIWFEHPCGLQRTRSKDRPNFYNTRLRFPQTSADLSVRWCSSYLKIDVFASAIRNQARFSNQKILVVTGERAEESPARSKYQHFENHRTDLRHSRKTIRLVDHWRPVRDWTEEMVWEIIRRYRIHLHPAYYLGFGRVSCLFCIFGNQNQWASARHINPKGFQRVVGYERKFDRTIKRGVSIDAYADLGKIYPEMDEFYLQLSRSKEYNEQIILSEWRWPKGAFQESCGPV